MQVDGLEAVSVFIVGGTVGVFVSVNVLAQLYQLVDRPLTVFNGVIEVGNGHVGVLFDKHTLVEEGSIHHVEHVGGDIARSEVQLAVDGSGVGKG